MVSNLNEALKQFEAVEANLAKLSRLWDEIERMLPDLFSGVIAGVTDENLYREKKRAFEHIAKSLPKIDGHELDVAIVDCDGIQATNLDLHELDEFSATVSYDQELHRQGELISDYRFRVGVKRRKLARDNVLDYIENFESRLHQLKPVAEELAAC
jgi:hypothetical protein